jgi:hypothetical protein
VVGEQDEECAGAGCDTGEVFKGGEEGVMGLGAAVDCRYEKELFTSLIFSIFVSASLDLVDKHNPMSNIKLFESQKIRSHWEAEKEKWYFSVIDIIEILTESPRPRKYWNALKTKLKEEGSELSHHLGQLKMEAEDGKGERLMWQIPSNYCDLFNPSLLLKPNPLRSGWPRSATSASKRPRIPKDPLTGLWKIT